jgi:hypothetical protein
MKKNITIFICIFFASAAFGQINVRDSIRKVLLNDTVDTRDRFDHAAFLITRHASPEEAEDLCMNVLYPFGVQTGYDKSEYATLMRIYTFMYQCHRERGGDDRHDQQIHYLKKAVEAAKKSKSDVLIAYALYFLGVTEIPQGEVAQGCENLFEAITYYDKAEMYAQSQELLHVIATVFFDMRDLAGMERTLRKMEEYFDNEPSKQSLYQYYYIKHRYFEALLEKNMQNHQTVDQYLLDSALFYVLKNIDLVEKHLDELDERWMHAYVYYNMARMLDKFRPEQTDLILLYLEKADVLYEFEEYHRTTQIGAAKEFLASAGVVRARALSRTGQWTKAYKIMTEALTMFDEIRREREKVDVQNYAYKFMIEYYEKFNNPAQALKFLRLLRENEIKLYEKNKIEALNEMSIKYETEKKEIQIEKYKVIQRNLRLMIYLLAILLIASFFIILSARLKRKNVEQRLYETALLAELHQNELQDIKAHKHQSDKQQLEVYRVQNTLEGISQMVYDSLIEVDSKKNYLERLTKLDPKLLEGMFQNSGIKMTGMDIKYIICFAADMDTKDISLIFNVEPASVNTVRYRIRKKCSKNDAVLAIL